MRIPTGDEEAIDRLVYLAATATKKERDRCLAQVEREKNLWRFNSCSRSVNTALESLKAMIRGTP